jgi:hypothetical protein
VNPEEAQPLIPYAAIRYVGIGEITIYFVSDDELSLLEKGGISSTFLNLAILFLSVAATFFTALLLSPPPPTSGRTFIVMVVLTTSTAIAGLVLILLWRRSCKDVTDTIKRIRGRKIASGGEIIKGTRIS